ncbi:MAG: hypothetical protein KAS63_08005 [Candidatus Heimdallarchaeota archaeon]|nr:hypothetical protein [Candidatus Heimdallarchaeota archaeon]MCK4955293.1 hypothetical protein [Candidatus Heimdallarchaeota archaeon]
MSTQSKLFDKEAAWPSLIAVFAIALLAQVPHFYYLHDIMEFNNWETISLLIAFPIFGAIGLSAVSLLISDYSLKRIRDTKERNIFRSLVRGSFYSILIYFVVQFFFIFFLFEAVGSIRNNLPTNPIDSVAFKEILGMSVILIIGIFINPPEQLRRRRK